MQGVTAGIKGHRHVRLVEAVAQGIPMLEDQLVSGPRLDVHQIVLGSLLANSPVGLHALDPFRPGFGILSGCLWPPGEYLAWRDTQCLADGHPAGTEINRPCIGSSTMLLPLIGKPLSTEEVGPGCITA